MHKSSLLIAGMFSFLNAGSGSNQSNHMYKLGPIHQGVVERGSKTTSDSYILWPAKVGAFSLIMGIWGTNFYVVLISVFFIYACSTTLLPRSRRESQKRGNYTRRTKVAQARQAHRPRQARLYQLQSAQSLHYTKDAARHRHITGIETDIG